MIKHMDWDVFSAHNSRFDGYHGLRHYTMMGDDKFRYPHHFTNMSSMSFSRKSSMFDKTEMSFSNNVWVMNNEFKYSWVR